MFYDGNEVITLAFGHYSSHIATHFYNIQEASFSFNPNFSSGIDHNILFRENRKSPSLFSPRLVILDDEDSLGYLSREGYYKDNREEFLPEVADDPSVIVEDPKWEKNEFLDDYFEEKRRIQSNIGPYPDFLLKSYYNLDNSVVSWSDYVVAELDENSIVTLPKHTEYYDNYEGFTSFDAGYSLWQNTCVSDVIEERIRFFLEEADNFQGFHILADSDKGYSGISSSCLEFLRDDHSKKTFIAVPSIYFNSSKEEDIRILFKKKCDRLYSLSSCFSTFSDHCDLIAPMSHVYNPWGKVPTVRHFQNLKFRDDLMYHTSGLLATAFDLITLPYRLKESGRSMSSLSTSLNIYGRCFTTVGLNVPFPVKLNGSTLPEPEQTALFESLTPLIGINNSHIDIQSITSKGLGRNKLSSRDMKDSSKVNAVQADFKTYLQNLFPRVFTQLSSCSSAFRVPRTFPKIFDSSFNLKDMYDFGPLPEYIAVGGLHNSKEMYKMLTDLYEETKVIKKRASFRPPDSDVDYENLFEGLKNASEAYTESSFL